VQANQLSTILKEKTADRIPILDLANSNPTTAIELYPHEQIRAALNSAESFRYQPDPLGLPSAREAVADYYGRRGYDVSSSSIALTASTSEAYSILFKLLCDPGDEVLIPTPSYPLFEFLAGLENVKAVPYRLNYDGAWYIDFENLRQQWTPRTKAIVIVNPNNPTGSFLQFHQLEVLLQFACERNLPILADEVFMDYELGESKQRVKTLVADTTTLSFSLNGLSKVAAMPQMKLAWIVVNGPQDIQSEAMSRLELILDTFLSVNSPVQLGLAALLKTGDDLREELQARIIKNHAQAIRILRDSPLHLLHTEGGWSFILKLPSNLSDEECALRLLREENTLVQPGFFFDMGSGAFLVVSAITKEAVFEEGLRRIKSSVERFTQC
jgi:alanine-synthesizing transaminase